MGYFNYLIGYYQITEGPHMCTPDYNPVEYQVKYNHQRLAHYLEAFFSLNMENKSWELISLNKVYHSIPIPDELWEKVFAHHVYQQL